MKKTTAILAMILTTMIGCTSQESQESQDYFEIETSHGRMVLRLYDETPLHRDNFAKLVDEGFYDNTTFHRVIANFMIQGGDPNSKDDDPLNDGMGGPGYTTPAEFNPSLFHKRGAIAAARSGGPSNPDRESSGSQFYIVHGSVYDANQLQNMEQSLQTKFNGDFSFSDEARQIYASEGGYPPLDMDYTVFGEIVEGFDVLDQIANTDTPQKLGERSQTPDRPVNDVKMTIRRLTNYSPK